MTVVKSLAIIALLFGGTSLAVAQNVPATGGQLKTGQPLPKQPWAAPTTPYYGYYGYGYPNYASGYEYGYPSYAYGGYPAYSYGWR